MLVLYEKLMEGNEGIYYCLEMEGNPEAQIVSVKLPYLRVSNDHVWNKLRSGCLLHDRGELGWFDVDPNGETAEVSYYLWVQDNLYRMYAMVASKGQCSEPERRAKVVYGLCFTYAVIKVIEILGDIIKRNFGNFDPRQENTIAIVKRLVEERFSFVFPTPPIHIAFLNAGFQGAAYAPYNLEFIQVPTINPPVRMVRILQEGLEDTIKDDFDANYFDLHQYFLPHDQIDNQGEGSVIMQYIGHYRGSRVSEGLRVKLDDNEVEIINWLKNIFTNTANLKIVNLTACETASSWRDGNEPIWEGPGLGLAERVISEANIPCVYATLWVTYSNYLSRLTRKIYTRIFPNNNVNPILVHSEAVREDLEGLVNALRPVVEEQFISISNISSIDSHKLAAVEEQIHAIITHMGYICVVGGYDGARQNTQEAIN